jgi:hypothetical protein
MYWLIWIALMLAIPLAAGVWTIAGLRTSQPLAAEELDTVIAADEA